MSQKTSFYFILIIIGLYRFKIDSIPRGWQRKERNREEDSNKESTMNKYVPVITLNVNG